MRPLRRALPWTIVLAACIAGPARGDDAPPTGTRTGTVLRIGDAAAFGSTIEAACRPSATGDADPDRRYVAIQYFAGRHAHVRVLPLRSDFRPSAGDRVRFDGRDCTEVSGG